MILQVAGGLCDVPFLAILVAANQEQDDPVLFFGEIYAVSWPVVDPQFPDTFIKVFVVAKVAKAGAVKPDTNLCPSVYIPNPDEPEPKNSHGGTEARGKSIIANLFLLYPKTPLNLGFSVFSVPL